MIKRLCLVVVGTLLVGMSIGAEPGDRLSFPANRFSIAPLEGVSDTVAYQPVTMFLPATDAFAPNVNVQIQPYQGTIAEYVNLSQQQFRSIGLRVLSEVSTDSTVVWEYEGRLQGRALHWYAKAVQEQGKIYLVTATATDAQWRTVSAQLRACVDSFGIDTGR